MTLALHSHGAIPHTTLGNALDHNFFVVLHPDRTYHMRRLTAEELALVRAAGWPAWAMDVVLFLMRDGSIIHKSVMFTDSIIVHMSDCLTDNIAQIMCVTMIGNSRKIIFGDAYVPH